MATAVIVDAVRTAGGKRFGQLSGWHPADLAAEVLTALAERNGLDPALVDDVVMGQVACYVDETNTAVLIWTETDDATEAVVTVRNGGTAGLAMLVEWWNEADLSGFGA